MKKLLSIALLAVSTSALAVDVKSFRVDGAIISVGDSEASLISKAGKPRPKFYVYEAYNGRTCAATEYVYEVDMHRFTVTLCYDKIIGIDRKSV
ncbi:hypothetical protein [Acinetobacter chinensis]|uniref:hypothetical protein n=1 Tax=Acinetobacter chinensis TaxID=2004650 RepID=UPI0029350A16|nr:hypothetical protein [Acinetobacter chinensis]WOE40696.1 hypothetical protein QSG87_12485 [Acinetobacter chinensis]